MFNISKSIKNIGSTILYLPHSFAQECPVALCILAMVLLAMDSLLLAIQPIDRRGFSYLLLQ
jgi:hypothetical protein